MFTLTLTRKQLDLLSSAVLEWLFTVPDRPGFDKDDAERELRKVFDSVHPNPYHKPPSSLPPSP